MPISDDDLEGFGPSNVVPLTRASAASVNPQPDAAGKALSMAPGLGLPASVIGADLETFQQTERGQKAAQAIQNNGWISDYVARNPMAAEVSSDDYDNLEKVSKAVQPFTIAGRQGGLLQAAPEFFLHTVPEMASLLTSETGRARLLKGLGRFGEHLVDQLATPGQVIEQGFDIHDPAELDKALGLGLLIGLGKGAPKVENFPRIGRSTPGEISDFLHQTEGFKTRAEIDEFLAGKAAPGKDPKAILQIEYAKADAAKLDDAVAAAEASNTKARSPQMLEDFIAGHETESLRLPAEAVADIYRSEGKVPVVGDGLFGFVPGLGRDLALGVETGSEITVPVSTYIAHIDPAVHEKIKDLIRFRPEGLTVEEAKVAKTEPIEAYHGSPHTFDAFSLEKIGTGEGAQSYGHGLYFAENPAVATEYRETLAGKGMIAPAGKTEIRQEQGMYNVYVDGQLENSFGALSDAQKYTDRGSLYKVSISANREHFLDWDKPLSKQPEILAKLGEHDILGDVITKGDASGEDLLLAIAQHLNETKFGAGDLIEQFEGYDKKAPEISKLLAEAGIPGIKYLDQGSRAEGEGTSNFVVFDPASVTILERNGERLRNEAVQEETELGLRPLFSEPPPDMTKPEFERYNRRVKDVQQAILDRATKEVEREKDAKLTKEWKAQEAEVRQEMTGVVAARPDVVTEAFLKRGKLKLDEAVIDALVPDNAVPAALKASGGAHPDDIAPFVGYESGAELAKGLSDLILDRKARGESPTKQLDRLITEATAFAMETRHGDFGRQIAEEARALALDDIHFDLLSDELRALARQAGGQPPLSKDDLKEWVSGQFSSLDTKEAADFGRWQKAAGREGRKAEQALLKGDAVEAFKAKQRQVLSWLMAKEANRFAKDIGKIAAKIDRVQGAKEIASMDQEHFDQLRSMLASAGFGPKHPIPEGLRPLADFVAGSDGQLAVASWLTDGSTRPADPSKLTAQEMRDLGKSIDSMMHVGRAVKTLDSARGKAELQNVIVDIKAELDRFDLINQPLNRTKIQSTRKLGRFVNAWNLLVERMLDYTDQFNPNGPLTTYLDRPLRDSNNKEIQLTEATVRKLQGLAKLTDNSINDLIPNTIIRSELNDSGFLDLNRRNLRQIMGYMGSKSGIEKITKGEGVEEAAVWKLINDNATKADWQWVAGMHEIFDSLWKESAAMQERYTGVTADPITPLVMKSEKYGDFPGGYWPIKYDKLRSNIEGHIAAKSDLFDKFYIAAVTPQAYTMPRTQFTAPLDYSGQLMATHIRGVIHDISFREAVNNASKLINNAEFMAAMTQKWTKEYAGLMPGWLKDIANSHNFDDTYAQGTARFFSLLRQNITTTLIALNPGTYMKHGSTALGMSVAAVGAREFGAAAWDFGIRGMVGAAKDLVTGQKETPMTPEFIDALKAVTDPTSYGDGVRQFILDSSAMMRNRQRSSMDNVREAMNENLRSGPLQIFMGIRGAAMDLGRVPVAFSDAISSFPTWLAAYRKAMLENGDHVQAVFEADKQMTRAHGSQFIGDKPRSLRTGEAMKWVTPLYNFFNHNFNMALQWAWDAGARFKGREEPGANVSSLSNRLFWGFVWAVAMEELASPALDSSNQSLGQKVGLAAIRHIGAWFPGIRDFTNYFAHGYEPSVGFIGTATKMITNTLQDIKKAGLGKTASKDWLIHTATAIGMATGIGGTQIGRTGSYLKDRFIGAERAPRSWAELRQGLRTGHSKARIHK